MVVLTFSTRRSVPKVDRSKQQERRPGIRSDASCTLEMFLESPNTVASHIDRDQGKIPRELQDQVLSILTILKMIPYCNTGLSRGSGSKFTNLVAFGKVADLFIPAKPCDL